MAMIVDPFASHIVQILRDMAKEEVVMLLEVDVELQKLKGTLEMIQRVLKDAERKGFQDGVIALWLCNLEDVMYDAGDVMDHCMIEGERLLVQQWASFIPLVCSCYTLLSFFFHKVVFRHDIGTRIKHINSRLEEINDQKSKFALTSSTMNEESFPGKKSNPMFSESDIVGIDDDVNGLVDMLLEKNIPRNSIFAIVGMGGIGKTTFAQAIYNNERMKTQFDVPIWLCVTQNYSDIDLLKQIIRSSGGTYGDAQECAELSPIVGDSVRGKRLFLVLDDIWDAYIWVDLLKHCLQYANTSGRILVTTRNDLVARRMGAKHFHSLNLLSENNGWLMFWKLLFGNKVVEESMKGIGKQIVEKCLGLPLAIKAIVRVIRRKEIFSVREWEKVLHSEIWYSKEIPDSILPALYLSYQDLPSHLKQCFVCCSLLSGTFTSRYAVSIWISEGFVTSRGDVSLEEQGNDYYMELVRRNLFKGSPGYYNSRGCTVHDLLCDLAMYVAQGVYYYGDVQGLVSSPKIPRHLSIEDDGLSTIPNSIIEHDTLRTLLVYRTQLKIVPENLFNKLRKLWALDLSQTQIEHLPSTIGNLILLRFLDVSLTNIEELPESVGLLKNLQFIDVQGCVCLHSLPNSIVQLDRLRVLSLLDTPISQMLVGMRSMQDLHVVAGFVLGDIGSGCIQGSTMEDLKYLNKLRCLALYHLERVPSGIEAKEAALGSKLMQREWSRYSADLIDLQGCEICILQQGC